MPHVALMIYRPHLGNPIALPFYLHRVAAGFPSPADDYLEGSLNPNDLLIENPPATFIVRASGDSMRGAGICDGDYLVINRAATWGDGSIVLARIGDAFTLKRIRKATGRVFLVAENPAYQPIEVTEDSDCEIFGCLSGSFRRY